MKDKTSDRDLGEEFPEQGIRRGEGPVVHRKPGEYGADRTSRFESHGAEQMGDRDQQQPVKAAPRSRHLDKREKKAADPSIAREWECTRARGSSGMESRASTRTSQVAQSQPPSLLQHGSQLDIRKVPKDKIKSQPPIQKHDLNATKHKTDLVRDKNTLSLTKNVTAQTRDKGKGKINEKQTNINNYSEPDKDENSDKDEDYDDQLIKEIEQEMESLWNGDLEGADNIQGQREEEHPMKESNQGENQKEPGHWEDPLKERGSESKNLMDTKACNKELQDREPDLNDRRAQYGIPIMQTLNREEETEETPPHQNPNPDLDLAIYKWRYIHGSWNYITDTAWESISAGAEQSRKEPATTRKIPTTLGNLCNLHTLVLSRLNLSLESDRLGRIFSGCLKHSLVELDLSGTSLDGSLPEWLKNLTNLKSLDLSGNNIKSTLPLWLYKLSRLENLNLASNALQGRDIPANIGDFLSSLKILDLSDNDPGLSLPTTLGNLCRLQELSLSGLNLSKEAVTIKQIFSGCILQSLRKLSLARGYLQGDIPDWIGGLKNLQMLDLSSNQINSTLPPWLFNLTTISYLDLSYNDFQGSISPIFENMISLEILVLGGNSHLEGPIPVTLGNCGSDTDAAIAALLVQMAVDCY
ncbi:hypothetical protein J5N97_028975 [Dioscorea zingiberensis]|uniref:Uncharacterized protein n=1 Tax=Dioscorea zingiberensis TaxID=325984 RepID=A0A9D5BZZ1_9LILI|nr:hypothetical protein J5N97_028975 [Dioscorea zingiberensis]